MKKKEHAGMHTEEELKAMKAPALVAVVLGCYAEISGLQSTAKTQGEELEAAITAGTVLTAERDEARGEVASLTERLEAARADLVTANDAGRAAAEAASAAEAKLAASGNVAQVFEAAERVHSLHVAAEAAAEASDRAQGAARASLRDLLGLKGK